MIELHILAPQEQVESLSDVLLELAALSVSVEDADAHTEQEQALFGEPGMPPPASAWNRSKVMALFDTQVLLEEAKVCLLGLEEFETCQILSEVQVPEEDWVRITQSQFQPVQITEDFWIVPSWHEVPSAALKVIRLDPGLAFGTGTHPTTRMCLAWAAQHDFTSERVMDYGCGSGILAIAAVLYGSSQTDAVDIDPAAVISAEQNARDNGVAAQIRVGLPDISSGLYDTVFANILATPLKVLAPLLCGLVKPGGHLVLAGILQRQEEELKAAYAPYCELQVSNESEGWILMTAQLKSHGA
jgi:ribosomal protein L11 methyltransferase